MDWAVVVVQWLHMLFGIFWFGGALFGNFVLGPVLIKQPPDRMRELALLLGEQGDRVILPVATLTIVLGFLRGTVFGPVRSIEFLFGTAYGITWLVALLTAIGTLAWGSMTVRTMRRALLAGADITGSTGTALRNAGIELLGFAVILSCMVLMRFGL
ncbi:MAG: hypothetical protein H0W81_01525 [Chloroflexi bacterium]|nr:hypothetical protein [Chloroflexota bacterium]